jgi:hypothetical protein
MVQEESYTSKASALDLDFIPTRKQDVNVKPLFSGNRTNRGIYKTTSGIINADVNAALNILRKEYGGAAMPAVRGVVFKAVSYYPEQARHTIPEEKILRSRTPHSRLTQIPIENHRLSVGSSCNIHLFLSLITDNYNSCINQQKNINEVIMTYTTSQHTLLERDFLSLDLFEQNEYFKLLLKGLIDATSIDHNEAETYYLIGKARLALNAETVITGSHEPQKGLHYAIHIEGGLVKDVFSKNNAGNGATFSVFDYDVSDINEEEISLIKRDDGTISQAFIEHKEVTHTSGEYLNDVYNTSPSFQYLPLILADFDIVDWRILHRMDVPAEHECVYRCVIEQSKTTNQVYFKLYPKVLDSLNSSITLNGLSGVIDVQNGMPTISIGLEENENFISIQSDIHKGLYVSTENNIYPVQVSRESSGNRDNTSSYYYCGGDPSWLGQARAEKAEIVFQRYDFPHDMPMAESSGWEIDGDQWKKTCFFDNPSAGDSIKGYLSLTFAPNSIHLTDVTGF